MHEVITTGSLKFLARYAAAQGNYGAFCTMDIGFLPCATIGEMEEVIVISDYVAAQMTSAELQAIVLHEEGHFVHEHNRRTIAENSATMGRDGVLIMANPAYELEADEYAATIVGAACLSSALSRLADIMYGQPELVELGISKGHSRELVMQQVEQARVMLAASLKYRIDALA